MAAKGARMIVDGQERFDGLQVHKWQLRFAGTLDLEPEDAELMSLDRVVIFLCATRNGGADMKVLDSGEVRRKNVANVSDFVILTGDTRERAISALANGTDHGVLTPPTHDGAEIAEQVLADVDRLAKKLMHEYPTVFDRSEGAIDMAVRILDDPRVAGVVNGTMGTVDLETGERVGHIRPVDPPAAEIPTAVESAPPGDVADLEQLPEHEMETDPGWTPDDDEAGWDPRDLPEPAANGDLSEGRNQNPDPESEAARAAAAPPPPPPPPPAPPAPVEPSAEPTGPPVGEVVGHINDRSGIKDAPRGGGRDGPGVGKFDPSKFDAAPEGPANGSPRPTGPERVGVAYPHRDPVLARFMDEEVPR